MTYSIHELHSGHFRIMELTEKEKGADGWAECAPRILKHIRENFPSELIETKVTDETTGRGAVRLTDDGRTVLENW